MSDTLQEGEDQMDDDGSNDWCDDCHGYTHMPWCPVYQTANTGAVAFVDGTLRDIKDTSQLATTSEHEPAARSGGEEWRYREGSGVIYADTVPTKIIARYVDADVAQQIIIAHDLYQPMLDALKEVEAMLNKELARDYESQSWAKKVRAVLMSIEQRNTPQ